MRRSCAVIPTWPSAVESIREAFVIDIMDSWNIHLPLERRVQNPKEPSGKYRIFPAARLALRIVI